MRRTPLFTILIFVAAFLVVFIFHSTAVRANSLTVSGTVAPVRAITVNSQQIIVEIASNCSFEVTPMVYLVGNPSQSVAYSSKTREQYIKLSKNIDFSKFGVVYRRPITVMSPQETPFWSWLDKQIENMYLRFVTHILATSLPLSGGRLRF